MANVGVIICAAGASSRFGKGKKKQFTDVAGRAAFIRSIELFSEREDVKQIILAISKEDEELVKVKYGANLSFFSVKICYGGDERFETVAKAAELLKGDIDIVAVHDAVRCCAKQSWIDEVIKKADETGAAMLAAPVVATIKKVADGVITETVDRSDLYEAQTPQVFKMDVFKKAYDNLDKLDKSQISDDSQLVEAVGEKVAIVETDSTNIKITSGGDIAIAEAIIKSRPKGESKGPLGPYEEAEMW